MKIRRERVSAAPAQARAPRNVAHESTVTRPQSAASANIISNFPEDRLIVTDRPDLDNFRFADDTRIIRRLKMGDVIQT